MITAACLGIGLAASCGFRVFVPLLIASIAAKTGIIPVSDGFAWLGSWTSIACFSAATVTEIAAYYIPFVDNLLDTVAIPMAIGGGTLLSASVFPVESDLLRWIISFIVGGGSAAAVQAGTTISRLVSTKMTAGTGNFVVSSGENIAAFGTPILTILRPVLIAVILLVLIGYFLRKIYRKFISKPDN